LPGARRWPFNNDGLHSLLRRHLEIVYFNFLPDFGDKYAAYAIEKARAAGASADEIAKQTEEMRKFKEMYSNIFVNAAFTFLEPLPVGLPMTLISALILRKRRRPDSQDLVVS
jgi:hypothetical protein